MFSRKGRKHSVLVCYNPIPQTEDLHWLTVLEAEVRGQGIGRFGFSWDPFPWLAGDHFVPVPSQHLYSVLLHPHVSPSSYKDTSHIGWGSIPSYFYLTLIMSVKTLSLSRITCWGVLCDLGDIVTHSRAVLSGNHLWNSHASPCFLAHPLSSPPRWNSLFIKLLRKDSKK